MVVIVLSLSRQSFPPAEAIRHSSQIDGDSRFLTQIGQIGQSSAVNYPSRFAFRKSQPFRIADECRRSKMGESSICDPSVVHIAITLDREYLRGLIAIRPRRRRRRRQALEHQPWAANCRRAGILPRELHQVLHGQVLVGRAVFQDFFRVESVLFQHGRDGDGSGEVEEGGVQEEYQELEISPACLER
ncbi:hypothetical protein MRB53_033921 [Persea americana]|uniref:Uncharacterized protein n=1 Tax=Persea americana TaxID=3435 RepID=A0ACC2KVU0_PERAE|nr:hypothetical protein MRB53_033921 [Persea americana]